MSLALLKQLQTLADSDYAQHCQRFFKVQEGGYAQHERFLGIRTPQLRALVKPYAHLELNDIQLLLDSPFNEARSMALFLLVFRFQKESTELARKRIFNFYKKNTHCVNNWNLVDISAHLIMGAYLFDKDKILLYRFAKDKDLWRRRIAIVSTWYFIRQNDFKDTLMIAQQLLQDKEDLIHKAVGWMLREVGKRDEKVLLTFLDKFGGSMARTTLRYAIERLPKIQRTTYLSIVKTDEFYAEYPYSAPSGLC